MLKLAAFCALFVSCGKPPPAKANPCATKNSTYLMRYVDMSGGNCGPIPDLIVNIDADGTIPGEAPKCDATTQDGCTARNTNCEASKNGIDCTMTSSITFTDDGASASGLATINCSGSGSDCLSTYKVTMARQ